MKFSNKSKVVFRLFSMLLIVILIGCSSENSATNGEQDKAESESEPSEGGTLKIATGSEPDTLDWMYISATATRNVAWNIFENLFALDNNFETKPMVAESYDVSEDKTVYTIKLREGINFHDGSTVTAEDVIASINRWRIVSSVGKITDWYIQEINPIDEYTLEIKLNEVYSSLMSDMSAPKSALMIIPAEIAEEAGAQPLNEEQLIGTGPYKFEKWNRGNEIVLTKFEEYSARKEADWGGLTGEKVANFDEIQFLIVKDPQVMINGLSTGLYDYIEGIPADLYDVIESNPTVIPVTYMNGYHIISLDKSEAPFDDLKVRQAINHALDKEVIAEATYGNDQFYSLDGALFAPEQSELYSEEGTEDYLVHDKEKAKALLEESSYNGESLQMMYSNDTEEYKRIAQIAKQQMEEVGFKVELISYEWATYLERWMDPVNWDLVVIGWSTRFSPSELGMLELDVARSGWYESSRWENLIEQWGTAETSEQRKEILTGMNQTVYNELPFIKIANVTTFDVKTEKVKDFTNWVGPRFWNIWKSE